MLMDNNDTATASNHEDADPQAQSPFSKEFLYYTSIFIRILITGILCLAGVVSNIINIRIFYRQGPMSSSPTVILTGLACSDLTISIFGTLRTCLICGATFVGITIADLLLAYSIKNVNALVFGRPLNLLSQITCVYTMFLGFERVVSVVFPFKVRSLFTPKRSLIILIVIPLVLFIIHTPNLIEHTLFWYYEPVNKVSIMRYTETNFFSDDIKEVYFIFSPVLLRVTTVIMVVLCNVIIVWKVQSSKRFRKLDTRISTTTSQQETTNTSTRSSRTQTNTKKEFPGSSKTNSSDIPNSREVKEAKDVKMLRMITIVSALFVACYTPIVLATIFLHLVFEFGVDYHTFVENFIFDIIMVLQHFNSSVNILIYYNMSTKYKEEFSLLCRPCRKKG